ncbi:hypothetical protein HX071_07190 [Myroides marinus]|nr:hypothetical protein [Myroides marinus]MDM1501986.1 hypothetical protein [Myroides marinus]
MSMFCGVGQKEECPVDIMNDGPGEGRANTPVLLWILKVYITLVGTQW